LLSYTGPKIILYTFLSEIFNCFLSLSVSVPVSDAYVNVLCITVLFSLNLSFFGTFLFLKNFYTVKYVLDYVGLGMYREWKKVEFPKGYYI